MHQIYPDTATEYILTLLLTAITDFRIRLFTNNVVPDLDTVIGDLTEAAWTGYAEASLDVGDFTITTSGHLTTALASPVTFLNSSGAPVTAYGYYVVDTVGNLIAVARFDAAPVTIPDTVSYPVVPIIGDFSQYAS